MQLITSFLYQTNFTPKDKFCLSLDKSGLKLLQLNHEMPSGSEVLSSQCTTVGSGVTTLQCTEVTVERIMEEVNLGWGLKAERNIHFQSGR